MRCSTASWRRPSRPISRAISAEALALSAPLAQQSGAQGASAKLFRADVLRHNKDLPQAEQTLRSLLNDDPQNAAARENLYYVLREQNKSAEAQAMLQTLPQSLRQKTAAAGGGRYAGRCPAPSGPGAGQQR